MSARMSVRVHEMHWPRLPCRWRALLGVVAFGGRTGGQRHEHEQRRRARDERTDPEREVTAAHEPRACRVREQRAGDPADRRRNRQRAAERAGDRV